MQNPRTFRIVIDNIFGGQSKYENFSSGDQFHSSVAIDPDLSAFPSSGDLQFQTRNSSGYLRPANVRSLTDQLNFPPLWMITNPKTNIIYTYDAGGSVYSEISANNAPSSLGDLNDGGTATGNGAAYYDNYVYFARDTTIARYGPLDGVAAFTDDYWSSTLGKTALINTSYPAHPAMAGFIKVPNHVMLRHTDGKLYFADVVGNQGVLHCISTSKASVEGDTDNGSTYNAIDFPYGMYISALASLGDKIAVALFERNSAGVQVSKKAKIAIWDPTNPTTYNLITDEEFPDPMIYALSNGNGNLYIFSADLPTNSRGVRITRYLGGYSFSEVAFIDFAFPPLQGGVITKLNKILFGSNTEVPVASGCVFSIGSKKSDISNAVFNVLGILTSTTASAGADVMITTLAETRNEGLFILNPELGWTDGNNGTGHNGTNGTREQSNVFAQASFRTKQYRMQDPFKITRLKIPIITDIQNSTSCTPKFLIDNSNSSTVAVAIDPVNYPLNDRRVIQKFENLTGNYNMQLQLDWKVSDDLLTLGFPIIIDGEYLNE